MTWKAIRFEKLKFTKVKIVRIYTDHFYNWNAKTDLKICYWNASHFLTQYGRKLILKRFVRHLNKGMVLGFLKL